LRQPIRDDVKELLAGLNDSTPSVARRQDALIGAGIGAFLGFVIPLLVLGLIFNDGQVGILSAMFGVPLGAWIGAEIGAASSSRRNDSHNGSR
jgi:hypothetical protein